MSEAENIQQQCVNPPAFNSADKTILVVEDDRTHRKVMETILKDCEFRTIPAENGLIALSKIDSGQAFDLVIMDWDMPELNGLDTVREIRAREARENRPHMPVIAFTSHRQPGDRERCIAAGMDAYLPKDVWMPKWRQALIDQLQGLIAGNFKLSDLNDTPDEREKVRDFDLDAFDMQMLEQSAALLKEDLPVAVEEYLEDAAAYIRDIKDGLESDDAEKTARGSHPLKSNSKNFGLSAVSQIAEAVNMLARQDDLDSARPLLAQLQSAFNRAERKLRAALKNAGY
ncbi:MAG: response regulator [Alphaproteobacteria bacterium]|nr:response regulator [Alphaproteobacteria bacterium]